VNGVRQGISTFAIRASASSRSLANIIGVAQTNHGMVFGTQRGRPSKVQHDLDRRTPNSQDDSFEELISNLDPCLANSNHMMPPCAFDKARRTCICLTHSPLRRLFHAQKLTVLGEYHRSIGGQRNAIAYKQASDNSYNVRRA
jgi:hypothetical protein